MLGIPDNFDFLAKLYGLLSFQPTDLKCRMLNDWVTSRTKYFHIITLLNICSGINLLNFKALFAAWKISGVNANMSAKNIGLRHP